MLIAEIEPAAITNAQEKKIYNIIKGSNKEFCDGNAVCERQGQF